MYTDNVFSSQKSKYIKRYFNLPPCSCLPLPLPALYREHLLLPYGIRSSGSLHTQNTNGTFLFSPLLQFRSETFAEGLGVEIWPRPVLLLGSCKSFRVEDSSGRKLGGWGCVLKGHTGTWNTLSFCFQLTWGKLPPLTSSPWCPVLPQS